MYFILYCQYYQPTYPNVNAVVEHARVYNLSMDIQLEFQAILMKNDDAIQ